MKSSDRKIIGKNARNYAMTNLSISLLLLPLVPIGVFLGVWINRKLKEETFFSILLFSIFLVGLKLIWDGIFNVI